MTYDISTNKDLPLATLDILPNPVLIKAIDTSYVWVNTAFEKLFDVSREDLHGKFDKDIFPKRQVAQCNGGDLRVLETGEVDEAYEEVYHSDGTPCQTITRKSRLMLNCGTKFLVGVMHDVTEVFTANRLLEEQSSKLRTLANTDSMTGCLNRRALFDTYDKIKSSNGGLLLIDIDFFKGINDTYGHAAGDAAIIHCSKIIREQLRKDDILARVGGEEFVAYLPDANQKYIATIASRVRTNISNTALDYEGIQISMTVSIGGATAQKLGTSNLEPLIKEADRNLYKAKQSGRNRSELAA